jgi:hypothetical protein
MKRPIASDFDGTYDAHPEIWGQVNIIITGNPWDKYESVMNRWVGPEKPIYFNPAPPDGNVMAIISHKADILNKTKARKFYEDQQEQVDILKIMAPECEIILVKEGSTFI